MEQRPSLRLTRSDLLRRGMLGVVGAVVGSRVFARDVASAARTDAGPTLVARDMPVPGGAERRLIRDSSRFNLLGVHWRGPGKVWFRTRDAGRWSAWQEAVVHELADEGEGELAGWRLGTPVWTGGSTAAEYRVVGDVQALRTHEIWSPVTGMARSPATAPAPFVLPRASWGADESIVRGTPSYAERLLLAVIHHTAGKNPSTPEESAAVVRGIQRYHVESNGWNDIGYNFLVDGFGQVFEGRLGGIDRNVIGAHALGYNTGSTGVALLGNFEQAFPSAESQAALVQLLAWRLDVGHVDPLALVSAVSTSGEARTLRAVSGHRDVGNTACPGLNLYPLLDGLAQQVAVVGLPKLYDPRAEPSGRLVRFTGRLSSDLPWTVSVAGVDGTVIAQGLGAGASIDWTWDATTAPDGLYSWSMQATADVLPATGAVALGAVQVEPPAAEAPPRPPRPAGLPRRIPAWAWRLRAWHRKPKAQRGARPPGTPRRPPGWYWPWFNWTNAVERWQREWGS